MAKGPLKKHDPEYMRLHARKVYFTSVTGVKLSFPEQIKWPYYNPPKTNGVNNNNMADTKFREGDIIETVCVVDGAIPKGAIGIVHKHIGDGGYAVSFDASVNDIPPSVQLHPCHDNLPEGEKGWYVYVRQMKLTNASPKQVVDFDSVVIEDYKRAQILEAIEQVNQQDLIFNKWGFGKTIEKGRGVSMLFYGPPGTGKTLMAQAIADKLRYTLKIIAAADIESSEPGQAERNIRDHFKGASGKKTILLFDECDSLVFDRTVVGAILGAQVNELLSSIEKFEGITIFTTNRVETLDEAVDRRLALKLEFAMPDQEQRAEIWKRMIPEECPIDNNIDYMLLAAVEIAGGHIKNSVLRAARIAATTDIPDEEKKITMDHFIRALRQEGKAMIAFKQAKERMNIPRMMGPSNRVGADRQIRRTTIKDIIPNIGDSHE